VAVLRIALIAVHALLVVYFIAMWVRFVLDLVQMLSREWRPRGAALVAAEIVYTVTDPPIRFIRRFIPPLRVGPVALDFAWTIVMLAVLILMTIVSGLAATL